MNGMLEGKVAVVSGASRGLGREIALELASRGARAILIARSADDLEAVAEDIRSRGFAAEGFPCDITDVSVVERTAAEIGQRYGRCDFLVNNAGIPAPRSVPETAFEDWNQVMGVNLSGAFYLTRALWNLLIAGEAGYVINVSGGAGKRGGGSPGYASSKFGLEGLTAAIAASGSEHNVRATALYPGSMDTGWRGAPVGAKPRREIMDPGEVARLVGYLATTPPEFVVNEAIINPIAHPWG